MVKKNVLWLLLSVAVLIVLAEAAGCGSSEAPPSQTAFVRQGNLACAEGKQEEEELRAEAFALRQRHHGHVSQKRIEQFISEQMNIYEGEAERLADLVPPAGDEKKIELLVSAMKEAAARYRANPEAGGVPFGKPGKIARAYGLDKCVTA